MNLRSIIDIFLRFILKKSSSNHRIRYLRKKGMKIGERCLIYTLDFSTEPYLIEIGNDVSIAFGSFFITHDGGVDCFKDEFSQDDIFGEIKIGNNVFIGMNCTILPNTQIGNNSIVGAGSVVRGKFPDNKVIFGNPAKVVLSMNIQKMIYRQEFGRLATKRMSGPKKKVILKHFEEKKK